jgi:hypothetical protein
VKRLALLALFVFGCGGWHWDPPPSPEDIRVCAPARYYFDCMHRLGYRQVQE